MLKKYLKRFILLLFFFVILLALFLRIRYGGGKEYTDVSTAPIYTEAQTELFFSYEEPIGNIAVSRDSTDQRVFFSIHPESRPKTNKLMVIKNGKASPYPDAESQSSLFKTVLGVFVDDQQRLWTIDHGNHGFDPVKLLAFDLKTDQKVHEHIFPKAIAQTFSFFNDLSVSPDGNYVFISDVSFFRRNPAIVVYNIKTGKSRRILEGHEAVKDEGYVPVTPARKMRFAGGLVDLLIGVDGLDVTKDGKYLYFAAMGHSKLYRIPVKTATDFDLPEEEIDAAVELVGVKPLSDGIRTDFNGNVYITDIEHNGVYVQEPSGKAYTLIKDPKIRWADGFSLGGDGYMYLADSDLPNQMLKSKKHMKKHAPYHIYRFPLID
ncbi:hypothetical protein GWK08_10850 [Leptobacterium flavescens]|uniref:Gluconolactonase n=1 Tax=Leptobacterium flavescens TaxID=472055 RepID=A0A6P0UKP6_9FLAO|nr:L-dopachrome tautomerase-related protein [Leptobacterium flavescens]NER13941.1 hypothetical protein [Leptobacterium flavescens]